MTVARAKGDKAKCDRLFSQLVRAQGCCQNCGKTTNLQCCHIRSRRYNATRCDFDNAFCLCAGCHRYFTDNPYDWRTFCDDNKGCEVIEAMYRRAESVAKVDWSAKYEELKRVAAREAAAMAYE